jgi:VanZ family protein
MTESTRYEKVRDGAVLAVAVGAIYATLSAARRLQFAIDRAGYQDAFTGAPIAAIALCVAAGLGWIFFVKRDRRPLTLLMLGNVAIAYVLMLSSLADIPVERFHLIEYGVVGFLALRATRHYFPTPADYGVALLLVFDIGFVDELIQGVLPDRVYDVRDVMTNGIAGLLGLLAVMAARRPMPPAPPLP